MDDVALVAAARRGDRDAWGLIYDRYADRLHDHCWSILRDEHEAADALHDAFVNAARALPQLRDPSRLRPWLYAIARNEAFRRHRARARVVPTDELGEFGEVTVSLDEGAGAPVDDLRRLVWDAAGGLSADDQALLDLHLRQGLEGTDLAEAMGITANNAYVKLSRLRDTLERSLGALLVARTGRQECPDLSAILAGWDGALSPLLRKRIARHIEECDTCGERKKAMVSPLALLSGMPLVPAPMALREQIVDDAAAAAAATPDALFPAPAAPPPPVAPPPPTSPSKGPPWGWIAAAAAAVVVLLAVGLLAFAGGEDDVATDDTTTTSSSTTSTSSTTTSTSSTTTSTSTTSTTVPPGQIALSTSSLDLDRTDRFTISNSGGAPISYVLTTTPARLGVNRRTGTLQPGAGHTIVVLLDRNPPTAEGPFQGGIRVAVGDVNIATVAVTADIAPRPPVIGTPDPTPDVVFFPPNCPATQVVATFSEENLQAAVLFWRDLSPAPGPEQSAPMTVSGNQVSGTMGRPATPSTPATMEFWIELTDAFGLVAQSPPTSIPVATTSCPP